MGEIQDGKSRGWDLAQPHQTPSGSQGDEQGKCSPCAWRVTGLLPGLWLLKLFPPIPPAEVR